MISVIALFQQGAARCGLGQEEMLLGVLTRKNSFSLWDKQAVEPRNPRIIKAALCLIWANMDFLCPPPPL